MVVEAHVSMTNNNKLYNLSRARVKCSNGLFLVLFLQMNLHDKQVGQGGFYENLMCKSQWHLIME